MLWTCEEFPPGNELWDESNDGILKAVKFLFKRLLHSMRERYLPYYFIPSINVIEKYSERLCTKIEVTLSKILKDINSFIPHEKLLRESIMLLQNSLIPITKLYNFFEEAETNPVVL